MLDEIFSYLEMCRIEGVNGLQRGMNFRLSPNYSVVLMSMRKGSPYVDKILADGITIEYEGHDEPKTLSTPNPKIIDQPLFTKLKRPNENGKFVDAIEKFRNKESSAEKVKIYEKISSGIWSLKGYFDLIDYEIKNDGTRNVFIFKLQLSNQQDDIKNNAVKEHNRLIPSMVKQAVYKRDKGRCVLCGETNHLHYDHDLPFSKGGSSITVENVRLLCATCNLKKSDKIE